MIQKQNFFILLTFFCTNLIYCDSVVYQNGNVNILIEIINLPNKFYLERIDKVLCFNNDEIIGIYSDFNLSFDEREGKSYFVLEVKNADLSNKYLLSFSGGYVIIYMKNNDICNISYGFY